VLSGVILHDKRNDHLETGERISRSASLGMPEDILKRNDGNIEGHKWPLFHLAGLCFATAMRLLPQRRRFSAAVFAARAVVPLIRRTEAYRQQRSCKVDGDMEIALHFALSALTKSGVEFDPLIVVTGYEEVRRAHATGKGLLVICPHAALTLLLARLFHDDGLEATIITADPLMRVAGTHKPAQTLQPSPIFLVKILALLRGGRIICAMPDRAEHQKGQTVEFDTAAGPLIIAPALMHVAARCKAKVIFSEMHVEGRRIAASFAAPSPADEGSAEAITAGFVEFVRAHIESRSRLSTKRGAVERLKVESQID
jgi:lauroyl/myristoyl acyltransferase